MRRTIEERLADEGGDKERKVGADKVGRNG